MFGVGRDWNRMSATDFQETETNTERAEQMMMQRRMHVKMLKKFPSDDDDGAKSTWEKV